mgnify:CR=1 FL=1
MKHASVQVRALMNKDEMERYNALMEVGKYLEKNKEFDLAYTVQREIDVLVQPAIERLKERSRQRDRDTEQYLQEKEQG